MDGIEDPEEVIVAIDMGPVGDEVAVVGPVPRLPPIADDKMLVSKRLKSFVAGPAVAVVEVDDVCVVGFCC